MPDLKNLNRHSFRDLQSPDQVDTIPDPVATRKYDGAAYFMHISRKGEPEFISRRLSVKGHHLDRTPKLPHLADFNLPDYKGRTFHVELVHTGFDPNGIESHPKVSGILNSLAPKAIQTQEREGPVRAVLLDEINHDHKTYAQKLGTLKQLQDRINKPDVLFLPETKIGHENVKKFLEDGKKRGHEGAVVTSLTKRDDIPNNNHRYKHKNVGTYNLKVSNIIPEVEGKTQQPKESMGALEVTDRSGRPVAKVGTGFSHEQRKEIYRNPHRWLGRTISVKAMPTTARRLRAPVFNGDADGDLDLVKLHDDGNQ